MAKLIQDLEQGDLVLIELMVHIDGEGFEEILLKALSELDDKIADFHDVVKPGEPEYKDLLEHWETRTEAKKGLRETLNKAMEKKESN